MYVLTKRTAPSDRGSVMHSIHGHTTEVQVARAWFRATRTTDVVECINPDQPSVFEPIFAASEGEVVSASRFPSWREKQLMDELAIARLQQFTKDNAKGPVA